MQSMCIPNRGSALHFSKTPLLQPARMPSPISIACVNTDFDLEQLEPAIACVEACLDFPFSEELLDDDDLDESVDADHFVIVDADQQAEDERAQQQDDDSAWILVNDSDNNAKVVDVRQQEFDDSDEWERVLTKAEKKVKAHKFVSGGLDKENGNCNYASTKAATTGVRRNKTKKTKKPFQDAAHRKTCTAAHTPCKDSPRPMPVPLSDPIRISAEALSEAALCLRPQIVPIVCHCGPPTAGAGEVQSVKADLAAEFQEASCGSLLEAKLQVIGVLEKALQKWVLEMSVKETIGNSDGGSVILAGGSFSLGMDDECDDSDVDLVCLVPNWVQSADFFQGFPSALLNADKQAEATDPICVEQLMAITAALVPRITCRCKGVKFDLLLSRVALPTVPAVVASARQHLLPSTNKTRRGDDPKSIKSINCLLNGRLTVGMDDRSLRSLGGPIVSTLFRQLVPCFESFQKTLWFVRRWARARGIYSNKTGFLGGVGWAVLTCFVCQCYPTASPSTLVHMFFELYSKWQWGTMPVLLTSTQALRAGKFSNPVMSVMTPAWPASNVASHVSRATLAVMQREFMRGWVRMNAAVAGLAAGLPTSTGNAESKQKKAGPQWDAVSKRAVEERRSVLGEFIYGIVEKRFPSLAGKITGMLLEMDLKELCRISGDASLLEPALQLCCNALRESGVEVNDAIEGCVNSVAQHPSIAPAAPAGVQQAQQARRNRSTGVLAELMSKSSPVEVRSRYRHLVCVDAVVSYADGHGQAGISTQCTQWASKQQLFVQFVASRLNKLVLSLDALPVVALVHPVDEVCRSNAQGVGNELARVGHKQTEERAGDELIGEVSSFWLGIETTVECDREELMCAIRPVLVYFLATEASQQPATALHPGPLPAHAAEVSTAYKQHVEAAFVLAVPREVQLAVYEHCTITQLHLVANQARQRGMQQQMQNGQGQWRQSWQYPSELYQKKPSKQAAKRKRKHKKRLTEQRAAEQRAAQQNMQERHWQEQNWQKQNWQKQHWPQQHWPQLQNWPQKQQAPHLQKPLPQLHSQQFVPRAGPNQTYSAKLSRGIFLR
jgi:poly(A) polymerase Pap1